MDELFDVRNNFYLGHFQQCITSAQKLTPSSADSKSERDLYMYRAYIAQGKFNTVVHEIPDTAKAELRAVRLYAQYLQSPQQHSQVLQAMELLLSGILGHCIWSIFLS